MGSARLLDAGVNLSGLPICGGAILETSPFVGRRPAAGLGFAGKAFDGTAAAFPGHRAEGCDFRWGLDLRGAESWPGSQHQRGRCSSEALGIEEWAPSCLTRSKNQENGLLESPGGVASSRDSLLTP